MLTRLPHCGRKYFFWFQRDPVENSWSHPWIAENSFPFGRNWTRPKCRWPNCWERPLRPYTVTSRVGEMSRPMWSASFFSCCPGRVVIRIRESHAGPLRDVPLNTKRIAQPGSLKQERSVGSSMERFVKEKSRAIGRKR